METFPAQDKIEKGDRFVSKTWQGRGELESSAKDLRKTFLPAGDQPQLMLFMMMIRVYTTDQNVDDFCLINNKIHTQWKKKENLLKI